MIFGPGFPDINIPDNKKDEKWHKQAVETIINRSLNQSYNLNYVMMNESINFFQGIQTGDEYKFLQESQDGEVLPAKWFNLNRIHPKLSIVMGEFMEKGYDISVKAINTEAISKKLEEKERLRVEMRLRPSAVELEEEVGLPFQAEGFVPENEEQLDEHMESTYKETSEFVMEAALKWLAKRFEWDYRRFALFRDILITGRGFAKVEIINGLPEIRVIDPRKMIFDTNATDDFLSDSTFFGEVEYMPISEAAERFKLTKEELKEVTEDKTDPTMSQTSTTTQKDFLFSQDNQVMNSRQDAGQFRVLVVTACWVDTKSYNHRISTDSHGNEHIKRVSDTEKGEGIQKRRIEIWRKGTLIGGKLLKNWGEVENQGRDISNLSKTYPPYIACIPFYLNGVGVSKVHMLKPLQDLKNITAYNMQLKMSQAGAKGFIYDIAQLPEDLTIEQVMKYIKVFGIGLIDSKKDGLPSNFNQFQQFDQGLSDSVTQYINIMNFVDAEMDAISGINEARQGVVQSSSQAVGVTQSALFQSNLATAPLFKLFRIFASRCFNQQARLVKVAWEGKEQFAPIIGDTGVDFLKDDIELDLNDYGVFVEEIPAILDDINSFRQFVGSALQSGAVDFVDALKLMQEKDIKVAIRKFEKAALKKEQQRMQEQMMLQQQQQEAQMQMEQMRGQQEQQGLQSKQQLEQMRGANDLNKTFAKGKIDLAKEKIGLLR